MKKIIILLFLLLSITVCGQAISDENKQILSSENILIDVRTPSEYVYDHLKNAVNIPYNKIKEEIKYIVPNKEKTIVLYCRSGRRADIAAKKLKELGYLNVINAGKYKDLKALEEKPN